MIRGLTKARLAMLAGVLIIGGAAAASIVMRQAAHHPGSSVTSVPHSTTSSASTHATPTPTPSTVPGPTPSPVSTTPAKKSGSTPGNSGSTIGGSSQTPGIANYRLSKALIYGSEIGTWLQDGNPAINTATGIPQEVTDAKVPVIRYAAFDCFSGTTCGTDNHAGTLSRTDFNNAISGIVNTMHAVPWIKLTPLTQDTLGSPGVAGTSFCPPWTGSAAGNQAMYRNLMAQVATIYKGPIIVESSNEMEYACTALWRSQNGGVQPDSAGAVGVSKRLGEHYAQNIPQLKRYMLDTLGFQDVITVGYVGIGGGTGWGQSCTADGTKTYGYACTYQSRWVSEFNTAVHDAYGAAGNNADYIPDALAIHAYPHSPDFVAGPTYELDDNIILSYYANWLTQSRATVSSVWGNASVANNMLFAISEWNAGTNEGAQSWTGWTTPNRTEQFYTAWFTMLRGNGATTGSTGTRFWAANLFEIASNPDAGTSPYYNIIKQDGTTPSWYNTFKSLSSSDPLR